MLFFTELTELKKNTLGIRWKEGKIEDYVNELFNVENLALNNIWGPKLGLGYIDEDGVYVKTFDNEKNKEN